MAAVAHGGTARRLVLLACAGLGVWVLSPPTVALDRAKKLPVYAREGVEHAWILDADAQALERLRLEDGHWSLHGVHAGNDVVRAEPFGEIDIELRLLWAWPAPRTRGSWPSATRPLKQPGYERKAAISRPAGSSPSPTLPTCRRRL